MSRWLRVRSVLDRVTAALALAVLWPLIAALALAIRLCDRGPGFVGVQRVGRHGQPFTMWKLRSMRAEAPDGRAGGISLTATNDSRITPIGVKLRAYYLDELPQLWNVIKGEMSVLGARPEAPEYVDVADPRWQLVLSAPPGIAGPTQLMVNDWERHLITACGAGSVYVDEVVPVKLAIDGWYIANSSPRLDSLVLVTLLRRFAPGTGSHTLKKLIRREVPESHAVDEDHAAARVDALPTAPSAVSAGPVVGRANGPGTPTWLNQPSGKATANGSGPSNGTSRPGQNSEPDSGRRSAEVAATTADAAP